MDGLINIYKEKGFTSHDVVAKMRGILHMKKIGHTGTLDPDATGVLPVCIGKGTRLCSLLENHDKTYQAVLLLGLETDTQDISGQVLAQRPVTVTEEQVMQTAASFRGRIMQIPPMYSALKVNGKKLYEYAREGKTIERAPRPVEIYELTIDRIELPRVTMTVSCSKGTYIRTLCHDIGQALGCGGCMESLVRTRVGSFRLEDAITLRELEEKRDTGELDSCIVTVEEIFRDRPCVHTREPFDVLIHNGNRVQGHMLEEILTGDQVRMYDSSGTFVGLYEADPVRKDYKPLKMFL
ncbi:MAG: tRNA pseudouridine(55) synthase TruB [Lachnospiraceae bacterium]|nr:tRNA pseudouridine(55) synthase TruB [Lachnospiraceae bacterium]